MAARAAAADEAPKAKPTAQAATTAGKKRAGKKGNAEEEGVVVSTKRAASPANAVLPTGSAGLFPDGF